MAAPSQIIDLIERFDRNLDAYRSGRYNETQRHINATDHQIDQLVYKLYDLTNKKTRIVEGVE